MEALGCRLLQLDMCDDDSIRAAVAQVIGAEGALVDRVEDAMGWKNCHLYEFEIDETR